MRINNLITIESPIVVVKATPLESIVKQLEKQGFTVMNAGGDQLRLLNTYGNGKLSKKMRGWQYKNIFDICDHYGMDFVIIEANKDFIKFRLLTSKEAQ
jgi:molybdopterin-guanine dinucleotide biosynthesis protein